MNTDNIILCINYTILVMLDKRGTALKRILRTNLFEAC